MHYCMNFCRDSYCECVESSEVAIKRCSFWWNLHFPKLFSEETLISISQMMVSWKKQKQQKTVWKVLTYKHLRAEPWGPKSVSHLVDFQVRMLSWPEEAAKARGRELLAVDYRGSSEWKQAILPSGERVCSCLQWFKWAMSFCLIRKNV